MSRAKHVFPPRRRNWTPGQGQIGLFVRTEDGSKIEIVWNKAPENIKVAAAEMVALLIKNGFSLE